MALFALRRLLLSIPLLIGITFVSFVVISLAPGGPLDFLTPEDPNASPEVKERLVKEFGLDRPIHVQYWQWLKRAVPLHFGRSFPPHARPGLSQIVARSMRQSVLEVVRQDYVQPARAKGLSERVVISKHALRNALLPVVTILALALPGLIGGSVIIESIFAIPGMGQLMVQSVFSRDYPVVMANLGIVASLTLVPNLVADITYARGAPRIRFCVRRVL